MEQNPPFFQKQAQDGEARAGYLSLRGQTIETPVFMPVGTNATVKGMTPSELESIGYRLILSNTYHLFLRPGDQCIKNLGGLHQFMNWHQGILTDSGGFQVFSLGKLNKITEEGVCFRSHLDGTQHLFSPEKAIAIQEDLGSDIMMTLDECLPIPSEKKMVEKSIRLTTRWAKRCLEAKQSSNHLFAIVQGADYEDLRVASAKMLTEIDFDGFAIGGLSVGESKETFVRITSLVTPLLPQSKPRYLMGVGEPVDLIHGIESGIDMFDCVMPTRNARNGCLFTFHGKVTIKQSRYKEDPSPIEETCECEVCQNYSKAYLRHLYHANEILSSRLNTYHNLWFLKKLTEKARESIVQGRFHQFKMDFLANYLSG